MGTQNAANHDERFRRIYEDTLDSFDEELEMELDDRVPPGIEGRSDLPGNTGETARDRDRRMHYFKELFRMQGELVKLQDWVVHTGHKLVVVFEGRDAAGKGG